MIDYWGIKALIADKITVPTMSLLTFAEPQPAGDADNTKYVSLVPCGELIKIATLADVPETSVVLRAGEALLPWPDTLAWCRAVLAMAEKNNSLSYWQAR